ncbi:hypothetical protein [Spongiactinospora sp. 9N601]|uniref:hypothetical protein n=1 Tax=Spongiactinospora sp. 9N601 TaxID=3375149 RepID=UPI003797BC19
MPSSPNAASSTPALWPPRLPNVPGGRYGEDEHDVAAARQAMWEAWEQAAQTTAARAEAADTGRRRRVTEQALEVARHETAQARTRAETLEHRAETARDQAVQARLELAAARQVLQRAEDDLLQTARERDDQRERAAAEQQAHAATADADRAREELRQVHARLAAAQAATGLVPPELADLGEGRWGVRLPAGSAVAAVTRDSDGVPALLLAGEHRDEHRGEPIRLADPARAGAAARALAAALLALTTVTGTFADTDASREMT